MSNVKSQREVDDLWTKFYNLAGPPSTYPPMEYDLCTQQKTYIHTDRLHIVTFLIGNGCAPQDVFHMLLPRLRDKAAEKHVCACVQDCMSKKYDHRWYYFDLRHCMHVYLSGRPCIQTAVYGTTTHFPYLVWCWERRMDEKIKQGCPYPSIREQDAYFHPVEEKVNIRQV